MRSEEKHEKLWPGDPGYKGGERIMEVVIDGKKKRAEVKTDPDGNVLWMAVTDKIWGIF